MTHVAKASPHAALLADLRERIRRLEQPTPRARAVLPFGVAALDAHLPEGGLRIGALHEVAGGGADAVPGAAAALFAAGVLARLVGPVLWCGTAGDLYAPGLSLAGLASARVLHVAAADEKSVLLVMEEGLRARGLAAVVGELARLPMTASRRLHLAAETSGTLALALRRRREGQAEDAGLTAAVTRWRITPLPSAPLPCPGIGRARWQVELLRCRGGEAANWTMEAADAQGRLALFADLADRPAAAAAGRAA